MEEGEYFKEREKINIVIANECNIPYLPVQNHPLKKAKVENIKELIGIHSSTILRRNYITWRGK